MRVSTEPITVVESGTVDYQEAWDLQRRLAADRVADAIPDTMIVLEHPPVFTAGKRTQPTDLPTDGSPVVWVDRGGRITWHGPGQLVVYPIVKLAEAMNVVAYVRLLEQAMISTCAEFGLTAGRVTGRSGVWFPASDGRPERKVGAIGVRIAKGVTEHGLALNCDPDLSWFDRIVPCGISDAGVTSLSAELGRDVSVAEVQPVLVAAIRDALDGRIPVVVEPDGSSADRRPAVDNGVAWQLAPALQG